MNKTGSNQKYTATYEITFRVSVDYQEQCHVVKAYQSAKDIDIDEALLDVSIFDYDNADLITIQDENGKEIWHG